MIATSRAVEQVRSERAVLPSVRPSTQTIGVSQPGARRAYALEIGDCQSGVG